jgi:hypothetical protein
LPQCDAALFVSSVDPPITEVELHYLAAICRTASRVIVVLNKVDLAEEADTQKAIAFLSSVLAQQGHPQIDARIFPISARLALAARRQRNNDSLRASGVLALEDYIQSELVGQKHKLLTISIAKKMLNIVDALQVTVAITVRAPTIPLSELDEKISFFEAASVDFQRERTDLQDLLTGEWRRALVRLDQLCDEADKRATSEIELLLEEKLSEFGQSQTARSEIGSAMAAVFDRELSVIAATVDEELAQSIEVHQQRYRALALRVGEAAATLFGVAPAVSAHEEWFQTERESYWIGQARIESLTSLTVDGIARLLPRKLENRDSRRSSGQP